MNGFDKEKADKAVSALMQHAEMVAQERAKIIDGYVQAYVKKCPKWMPKFVYRFIIRKVLVLAFFKDAQK